jgi:hypothetical protein
MTNAVARVAQAAARAALLALVICACGSDTGAPQGLPDPVQLDPPAGLDRLTAAEVERAVDTALADPTVVAALERMHVRRVLTQTTRTATPGGDPATYVAFLFDTPVDRGAGPYQSLCDIAGQTPEWRGVVARVAGSEVISSPLWLTGANCVGMTVPG